MFVYVPSDDIYSLFNSVSEGAIVYNFTYLDQAIERLHSLGLKPGFEIMGNPSNIFNDFSNK